MSKYEEYERKCEAIRAENETVLRDFASWLSDKGVSKKTVEGHRSRIEFFINEFLLYEMPRRAAEGHDEAARFLGYWFIRKALWSSEASIKQNATSLKKFYTFLAERGEVSPEALAEMKEQIKEGMPEWIETVRRYNDPGVDSEDVWQW